MKIRLKRTAEAAGKEIPAGEYNVGIQTETREIILAGGGKDYRLPAIKRKQNVKVRVTDVTFYSGGGTIWTIQVKTPPRGEWIANIKYIG
jgi:hypothetical protein